MKDKILCLFCGKDCKFENYLYNKNKPNAIKGLNSNFITEKISKYIIIMINVA